MSHRFRPRNPNDPPPPYSEQDPFPSRAANLPSATTGINQPQQQDAAAPSSSSAVPHAPAPPIQTASAVRPEPSPEADTPEARRARYDERWALTHGNRVVVENMCGFRILEPAEIKMPEDYTKYKHWHLVSRGVLVGITPIAEIAADCTQGITDSDRRKFRSWQNAFNAYYDDFILAELAILPILGDTRMARPWINEAFNPTHPRTPAARRPAASTPRATSSRAALLQSPVAPGTLPPPKATQAPLLAPIPTTGPGPILNQHPPAVNHQLHDHGPAVDLAPGSSAQPNALASSSAAASSTQPHGPGQPQSHLPVLDIDDDHRDAEVGHSAASAFIHRARVRAGKQKVHEVIEISDSEDEGAPCKKARR